MATRLKTIEYWFPMLGAVVDNTDTNFTQITLDIPDAITTPFKSVVLEVIIQDAEATANNVSRRQLSMQLASAGYSAVNNTNLLTASGEQKHIMASGDFTAYFNTNWTGTSMACDARILCDSAIATPVQGWRNASAKLIITYFYDDTVTTQVKTVRIPLITPIANLATAKPGTATDTIPLLDTFCPEASKSFKQINLTVEGNNEASATTDHTVSWEVDTLGSFSTNTIEEALNTAMYLRYNQIQSFSTSATHSFYIWASLASHPHVIAYLTVTYTYNESTSTSILNSLMLPMEFDSPAGGTTSSDYQRASRELWIEEPTTITKQRSALWLFWDQAAAVAGMQYRVGAGAWSGAIGSSAATVAGGCGASKECTSDISLARGINTLQADVFRTDTADLVFNLCGCWIINYVSGKATAGSGAHNKTIIHNFETTGTIAANQESVLSAKSIDIPETDYFITGLGAMFRYMTNTTGLPSCVCVQTERLSGEGGVQWETLYLDAAVTDALLGIHNIYSQSRTVFKRFPSDYESTRLDLESSRRYKSSFSPALGWRTFNMLLTYHSIIFTVSGTVSGSAGGTVTIRLVSNYDKKVRKETTRSGNGTYSFSWYDNTQQVWVDAYEDSTHVFRSAPGYAS